MNREEFSNFVNDSLMQKLIAAHETHGFKFAYVTILTFSGGVLPFVVFKGNRGHWEHLDKLLKLADEFTFPVMRIGLHINMAKAPIDILYENQNGTDWDNFTLRSLGLRTPA